MYIRFYTLKLHKIVSELPTEFQLYIDFVFSDFPDKVLFRSYSTVNKCAIKGNLSNYTTWNLYMRSNIFIW